VLSSAVVAPLKNNEEAFPPEYTELAELLVEPDPLNPVAEPTNDTDCPEQIVTSAPALAEVGDSKTVPLTATFTEDALVLLQTMLPEVGFEANAFMRTYINVLETVLLEGVKETLDVKPAPEVVETLKPVGAVTTKLPDKYKPDTEKDCCVLATLAQAEKALKLPDCDMVGDGAEVVKLRVVQPVAAVPKLFFGTILQ
jgi:hypothetical protein